MRDVIQQNRVHDLVIAGFGGLVVAMGCKIAFLDGLNAFGITFAALFLATIVGLLLTRTTWMTVVAGAVGAFAVVGAFSDPIGQAALADPASSLFPLAVTIVQALCGAVGTLAALASAVRTRRAAATRRTRQAERSGSA